jgi:acetolactate synthase small subunit
MPMPSLATLAAPEEREATAAFSVHARAEPGVTPRLLELFAKRGLVPTRWRSALSRDERELSIEIEMRGLAREMTDYIAACMRQIVGVDAVLTATRTDG